MHSLTPLHPLHQAVLDAPMADEPRLVFADWLSQQGDPRGAFISHQLHLESMSEADPRWPAVWGATQRLLAKHRVEWAAPVAQIAGVDAQRLTDAIVFRRGFIETVSLWSPHHIAALCVRLPLHKIRLGVLPAAYGLPAIEVLRKLGNAGGRAFAAMPWLPGLRAVDLPESAIGAAGAGALAGVPFTALRRLSLHGAGVRAKGMRALHASDWFKDLTWLSLAANQLSPEGVEGLSDLTRLRTLDLSVNPKLAGGLSGFDPPSSLRALTVRSAWGKPDVTWLAALAGQLSQVDLSSPQPKLRPGVRAWQQLAKADWSGLTRLRASNTRAGSMLHALISRLPAQLRQLDLALCSLEDDAVERLIATEVDGLTHLNLSSNKLTDRSAVALAAWPGLRHVTHLSLANNRRIKVDGLRALLNAEGFEPAEIDLHGLVGEGPLLAPLEARFGAALRCVHAGRS